MKGSTALYVVGSEKWNHFGGYGALDRMSVRKINKHRYVLVTFFFGILGAHRMMRGQIKLGMLMATVGWWATLGIWPLVDFIISLVMLRRCPGRHYLFAADGTFARPHH